MEQIKLHKQGGAAVIIIPASMIEIQDGKMEPYWMY